MKKQPQVFLSYAYEDREKILEISRGLAAEGFQPWMDVQNLMPGQDWDVEIKKALRASDFIIIFLSKSSIRKEGYLQKEIKSALKLAEEKPEGTVYVIPVRLDDVEIPSYLKHIQYLDLSAPHSWEKLLIALQQATRRSTPEEYELLKRSVKGVRVPKKYIFVAMPFSNDLEDCYFYGIKVPIQNAGFGCVRVDKTSFTGDILVQIKKDIEASSAVVAVLDGANPNVSLEVGYAWGREIPTILLVKDTNHLPFDLKGQKCLVYDSIRGLEKALSTELKELVDKGII